MAIDIARFRNYCGNRSRKSTIGDKGQPMADELASIRKEIAEVSDMIGTLASIELNLHNEQAQHAVRSVHIRESVRQVHQISERLAELAAHLDARLKAIQ